MIDIGDEEIENVIKTHEGYFFNEKNPAKDMT